MPDPERRQTGQCLLQYNLPVQIAPACRSYCAGINSACSCSRSDIYAQSRDHSWPQTGELNPSAAASAVISSVRQFMTPLNKRLVRESFTLYSYRSKSRKIVVSLLRGDVIRLHLKGTRVKYDLTVLQAFQHAARLKGQLDRESKKSGGRRDKRR